MTWKVLWNNDYTIITHKCKAKGSILKVFFIKLFLLYSFFSIFAIPEKRLLTKFFFCAILAAHVFGAIAWFLMIKLATKRSCHKTVKKQNLKPTFQFKSKNCCNNSSTYTFKLFIPPKFSEIKIILCANAPVANSSSLLHF